MNQYHPISLSLRIEGPVHAAYPDQLNIPNVSILEMGWSPFPAIKIPEHTVCPECEHVEIVVDRWYAHPSFFNKAKEVYEDNLKGIQKRFPLGVEMYQQHLNQWLAIVNHFGTSIIYRQEFVDIIDDVVLFIMIYAYRFGPAFSYKEVRTLRNQTLTNLQFLDLFDNFLRQYKK